MYVYHNFFRAYWAYLSKFPMLIPRMRPRPRPGVEALRRLAAGIRRVQVRFVYSARAVLARPKLIGGFEHGFYVS